MQDYETQGDEASGIGLAVTEVRDAVRRLRVALDSLDSSLGLLGRPRVAFQLLTGDPTPTADLIEALAAVDPGADALDGGPQPSAFAPTEATDVPRSPGWGWGAGQASAPPANTEQAQDPPSPAPAPPTPRNPWAAPASIRDGGWPSAPPKESVVPQPSEQAAPWSREPAQVMDIRDQVRQAVQDFKMDSDLEGLVTGRTDPSSEGNAWHEGADQPSYAAPDAQPVPEAHSTLTAVSADADDPAADVALSEPQTAGDQREDDDDVRETVRRAVAEARAEIDHFANAPKADWTLAPSLEGRTEERYFTPAALVIDDPEGRVELVRVYRMLARLDVAATANLANYSTHSVTVQLEERDLPPTGEITAAVSYAFERNCEVQLDGNRAGISLAGGKTQAS